MNEIIIKQQIENSLKENLNAIIRRQTDDNTLYSINVAGIARKLSGSLVSIVVSLTANLITPSIQEFISSIGQVEEKECIEITHDEALSMLIDACKYAPENNMANNQIIATFEEEYNKYNSQRN